MVPLTLIAAALAAQGMAAQPARPTLNPAAGELFQRDTELRAWALKIHDSNGDGWLTMFEAQAALSRLKEIADADRDGRVTVEFEAAKQFIRSRWAVQR